MIIEGKIGLSWKREHHQPSQSFIRLHCTFFALAIAPKLHQSYFQKLSEPKFSMSALSAIPLVELERGEGEWKNMQEIVRKSFMDCFQRLGKQQEGLEKLSQVIIGVNDRLSTRLTSKDVIELVDGEAFKRKVKSDGKIQDHIDKLEYNIARLNGLRSDIEKKADTAYVEQIFSRKLDKTDLSVHTILNDKDTIKKDYQRLNIDINELKSKSKLYVTVTDKWENIIENNLIPESHRMKSELSIMKSRMDSYPQYSEWMNSLNRKVDKVEIDTILARHAQSNGNSNGNGNDNGKIELFAVTLQSMQTAIDNHTNELENLRRKYQIYSNIGEHHNEAMVYGSCSGNGNDNDKMNDSLVDGLTPIKATKGGSTPGMDVDTQQRQQQQQQQQFKLDEILQRMDQLSATVASLQDENKQLKKRLTETEKKQNSRHGISTASTSSSKMSSSSSATATANANAITVETTLKSFEKVRAQALEAASKATTAAARCTARSDASDTVAKQQYTSLKGRLDTVEKMYQRLEKNVMKKISSKKSTTATTSAAATATAAITAAVAAGARTEDVHKTQENEKAAEAAIVLLSSRLTEVENSLDRTNRAIIAVDARLLMDMQSLASASGIRINKNNADSTTSASVSVSASELDSISGPSVKTITSPPPPTHMTISSKELEFITKKIREQEISSTRACAVATNAHSKAEEAIQSVERLRLQIQTPLSPTHAHAHTPTRTYIHTSENQHIPVPVPVHVSAVSRTQMQNQTDETVFGSMFNPNTNTNTNAYPKTPHSALLDQRIARLQKDKEDLMRLSQLSSSINWEHLRENPNPNPY
jgi:hypothetical protein